VWIVDPVTRQLVPRSSSFLDRFAEEGFVKRELWQSMVEINTGVCRNVDEVERDLTGSFARLNEVAADIGVQLMSSGTHPFSDYRDQALSEDARYTRLLEVHRWPAARLLICGMHVHVGVDSGEKAIAIVNAMTSYVPHMIALSASSPFWRYGDTGLMSSRSSIFDGLPKAGLPPFILNWTEFTRLMRTLLNSQTIGSIRDVWWDIRPHLGFGTVETRVCDALPTMRENLAMVAMVQALVVHFARLYDQGYPLPLLKHWTQVENKWRAIRHGLDAEIIRNEKGELVPIREHLYETLDLIGPTAASLDAGTRLEDVKLIIENGNSSMRQHRVWDSTHDWKSVVDGLTYELENDRMLKAGEESRAFA